MSKVELITVQSSSFHVLIFVLCFTLLVPCCDFPSRAPRHLVCICLAGISSRITSAWDNRPLFLRYKALVIPSISSSIVLEVKALYCFAAWKQKERETISSRKVQSSVYDIFWFNLICLWFRNSLFKIENITCGMFFIFYIYSKICLLYNPLS